MLPVFQGGDQPFLLMQTKWAAELNPILENPLLSGRQVSNVSISSGSLAVINHKLGRKQIGWFITDVNAPARIARVAALNDITLTLSSDATVMVSVWVY